MDKFELLCLLEAISNYAYDIHYTAKGRYFFSDHLFSERLSDVDVKDDFIETFYLGKSEEAPSSADIARKVATLTPEISDNTQDNFKRLRDLIIRALMGIQKYDGTKGEEDILGAVAHILQRHNGLLYRQLTYTPEEIRNDNSDWRNIVSEEDTTQTLENEKWITVHPNKENPDDYRRLKVEDGETSKEAVERKFGKDKTEKKEPEENLHTLSEEELRQKENKVYEKKRLIYQKIGEAVANNEKHKELLAQKEKVEKEYFAIHDFSDPRTRELSREIDRLDDEIRQQGWDIEQEETKKYRDELNELDEELNKYSSIRIEKENARKQKESEERKVREEEIKNKQIEKAKKNYEPDLMAGVKRGEPMSVEKADGGSVNPHYGDIDARKIGYRTNCQSCVVVYEARLRGYDVEVLPNKKGSALEDLSRDSTKAWIDMSTGEVPEPEILYTSNSRSLRTAIDSRVKKDERYIFRLVWKRKNEGHIVSIGKDNDGLFLYDPQTGKTHRNDDMMKEYLDGISLRGYKRHPWLLRVDDKAFNPEYYNEIMKKKD